MLILVANLGSTSFKYKLFDTARDEAVLAQGAADRIGEAESAWSLKADGLDRDGTAGLPDHGAAIELHLKELVDAGVLDAIESLGAVGFKAVHGGPISGAVRVDERVLETMQQFADVAPAHNPPYIEAMRAFGERLPGVPQVAAFETAFHQTIPMKRQAYAVPYEWTQMGIRRYGFHGASHRYIATRMAEIAPDAKRIINCHLGGSSSLCAIADGQSVATSMGLTPQSGLPQSGRVGDFEIFALLKLNAAGISTEEALQRLGKESGLLGISGISSDMRDIEQAAAGGDGRSQLAIDVYVEAIRHYIGAYMAVLNGVDAICFTGGIGQNGKVLREAVLRDFDYAGVKLDAKANEAADANAESRIDAADSGVGLWVLPTNEELIVARQTVAVLEATTNTTNN